MKGRRWAAATVAMTFAALFIAATMLGCGGANGWETALTGDAPVGDEAAVEGGKGLGERSRAWSSEARDDYATAESSAPALPVSLPQLRSRVIRTALMKMETARDGYARVREGALGAAAAAGGYLEGESSSSNGEGLTSGTLTLRIPAEKFDEAMTQVGELGKVVSRRVSSDDVSLEYVDLMSRLSHLQMEEAFYLALIDKARTVQEMVTIREHLSSVQLEKEYVQGRMEFLDQQVSYSTLTLSVEESEDGGEGFWGSVGGALKSFGRGMERLAIGLFYALPYLVILAVVCVGIWLLRRRGRDASEPRGEDAGT